MREPPDFHDLVGDDLSPEELERLRRADALLRKVPAAPSEVPATLTQAVAEIPLRQNPWSRRRLLPALALAAALAAGFFALGRWTGGGFEDDYTVDMQPTQAAPGASASIQVAEEDEESGNRELRVTVDGLPQLPRGEQYVLWLAKDGRFAATCGIFAVGESETTVPMTVAYEIRDFDAWAISRYDPDGRPPQLLQAEIPAS
jgi:hypothetical protein